MLQQVSERRMRRVNWILAIGWAILIASLFFDPITRSWSAPNNTLNPLRLRPEIYLDPTRCPAIQGECLPMQPFALGAFLWWAVIVPAGIFIIFVFGHEFWRRICPLSFFSQIPRALGIQRKRKSVVPLTKAVQQDLVTIRANSWLGRNRLYVQFGVFTMAVGARLLWLNGDRIILGSFLVLTILSAIAVGYLYSGKSWCQYFCPMSPVQQVFTGLRGLLGSQAHLEAKPAVTQSMCRTIKDGHEQNNCVGCKSACIDIDAEQAYWSDLFQPGRQLVQYGYPGVVIAFYTYYYLYSGSWAYYFTGAWSREEDQSSKIWDAGFFIGGHTIPIPKLFAVYLTFVACIFISFGIFRTIERWNYRRILSKQTIAFSQAAEQARHQVFTIATVVSFGAFFSFGGRPWINLLPSGLYWSFNALLVAVASIWLVRTFRRNRSQYDREQVATSLRKQLNQMDLQSEWLNGRQLDQLSADEVYTLVQILPTLSRQVRLQAYKGVLQDSLEQQLIQVEGSLPFFSKLRQDIQLTDSDHFEAIQSIAQTHPDLLSPRPKSRSSASSPTIAMATSSPQTVPLQPQPSRNQ
jgi:hypothetical protein